MNDILLEQILVWCYLECIFVGLLDGYGYSEICLFIFEFIEFFVCGIGEGIDVVDKEMYIFFDCNGEFLIMCLEGIVGCVCVVLEYGLSGGGQVQKFWYIGLMFCYEKLQKGCYWQFYQIGVEVFNLFGLDIDVELIIFIWCLWQKFGMVDVVILQFNIFGFSEVCVCYCEVLVVYLQECFE